MNPGQSTEPGGNALTPLWTWMFSDLLERRSSPRTWKPIKLLAWQLSPPTLQLRPTWWSAAQRAHLAAVMWSVALFCRDIRSWNVLSQEPSGDRIARSCRHTVPDLTVKTEVKDRIAKNSLPQYVLRFWGLPNHDHTHWISEIKSKQ